MNQEKKLKRPYNPLKIDRATLDKDVAEKLKFWKRQLDEQFQGLLSVTLSDLVNAIVTTHEPELTYVELECLKAGRLTELQKAKWIYESLRKAEKEGKKVEILELINKTSDPQKPKKIRRKKGEIIIEKT